QRSRSVSPREHVKRFDPGAPGIPHLHDLVTDAFVFKPNTWIVATLFHNIAPVALPIRAIPDHFAVLALLTDEVRSMLFAALEDESLLLKTCEVILQMLAEEP